jgi:hypothetical protein
MFNKFSKHIREFRNYLLNHQYEVAPSGILFPKANVIARGVYRDYINGVLQGVTPNLVVDEGLNHALDVLLLGGTQIAAANWYLGLAAGGTAPNAAWDATDVTSLFSEVTSATDGYTEANRQVFVGAADTPNEAVDNSASKAAFTMAVATSLTVTGAFLVGSNNTKGGTTGTLLSAVKYASGRAINDADDYEVQYDVDFNTP